MNVKLLWQVTDTLAMDLGCGYTFRQDGLDYITPSIGIRWDFDARGILP